MVTTIEIEIACESKEMADRLTDRVLSGNHWVGRKHGKWFFFCTCKPADVLHLGQELFYELHD